MILEHTQEGSHQCFFGGVRRDRLLAQAAAAPARASPIHA